MFFNPANKSYFVKFLPLYFNSLTMQCIEEKQRYHRHAYAYWSNWTGMFQLSSLWSLIMIFGASLHMKHEVLLDVSTTRVWYDINNTDHSADLSIDVLGFEAKHLPMMRFLCIAWVKALIEDCLIWRMGDSYVGILFGAPKPEV